MNNKNLNLMIGSVLNGLKEFGGVENIQTVKKGDFYWYLEIWVFDNSKVNLGEITTHKFSYFGQYIIELGSLEEVKTLIKLIKDKMRSLRK